MSGETCPDLCLYCNRLSNEYIDIKHRMTMKKNIGFSDRIIRHAFGLLLILAGIYFASWWGLLGLIPLATSASARCPVYSMAGISTARKEVVS